MTSGLHVIITDSSQTLLGGNLHLIAKASESVFGEEKATCIDLSSTHLFL